MKIILLIIILFMLSSFCFSQKCEVFLASLKGTYEGGCKKNKANGIGTATGEDSYTGEFYNGYPEGKGKYTWKNGNWFEGQWKKGLREGEGSMHYISSNNKDSAVIGFWKNDKYIGKYEIPYVIHDQSNGIRNIKIEFNPDSSNKIRMLMLSGGPQGPLGSSPTTLTITKIIPMFGKFLNKEEGGNSGDPHSPVGIYGMTLSDVKFPFRAKFIIGINIETMEIEFREAGFYYVLISIK
jgi:hypothetical protein